MDEDEVEVEPEVYQVPLDTDPDDELVNDDSELWPYDPDEESVPDEDEEGEAE